MLFRSFILDEPTTGLHFHDIARLLDVLARLRDANNTLVVIEHNMDIIKSADWVIDLGPEGGNDGGRIVAEGPPERIAAVVGSHTGRLLAAALGMEHLLARSEEHTSELQSQAYLVCRLLLDKQK